MELGMQFDGSKKPIFYYFPKETIIYNDFTHTNVVQTRRVTNRCAVVNSILFAHPSLTKFLYFSYELPCNTASGTRREIELNLSLIHI